MPARDPSQMIAGSFRDPSGHVFQHQERIFRAISAEFHQVWEDLCEKGLIGELEKDGRLVKTRGVESPLREQFAAEHPGFAHFLEHDRIAPLTYPYEWSFSMLADAAILTLDIQMALLGAGYSLKDASAYNVQFINGRPIFIDVTSIERPQRLDIWFALGQFQRMFLFPLLLCRRCGWDFRSYFLANLDGRTPDQVRQQFSGLALWRPEFLMDLALPWLLERREKSRNTSARATDAPRRASSEAQFFNLKRLRKKIAKLAAGFVPRSEWTHYTETCSYDESGETAKKHSVREFLEERRPGSVLDLGCNTGDYSTIAAECGARVIAADADADAIDKLYQTLRLKPRPILPVVLDISNPSPAIGFRNSERARFLDRVDADCLLALALLHHLLVSSNLSLDQVCHLFADLTQEYAVLEFVPPADPMFQRLLRFRVNLFEQVTLEACRKAFLPRFDILREVAIPNSSRTLLFLQKK
jgi:SAM-dependent methyltransferase